MNPRHFYFIGVVAISIAFFSIIQCSLFHTLRVSSADSLTPRLSLLSSSRVSSPVATSGMPALHGKEAIDHLKQESSYESLAEAMEMALTGSGLGQVSAAEGVTVTQFVTGPYVVGPMLIVGDTGNNRIEGRFIPTGSWTLIGAPDGVGTGVGQFRSLSKIQ